MKCLYDRDRKTFYMVPITPADRQIIEEDFNLKQAGDFVLIVRQDVIESDNQLSHLEIGQFLYSAPRQLSAYEFAVLAADPLANEPDPRGDRGTKRSGRAATVGRRAAILAFIDNLPPGQHDAGDVAILPPGTNPPDPQALRGKPR